MKLLKIGLLFIPLMVVNNVTAESYLETSGLTQGGFSFSNRVPLVNGIYDRELYETIAVGFRIHQDSENVVQAGEIWVASLIENRIAQTLSQFKLVALSSPADDGAICVYQQIGSTLPNLNDPNRQCFTKDPEPGQTQYKVVKIFWDYLKCKIPGGFNISVASLLETVPHAFELSKYVPGKPAVTGVRDITPKTKFPELTWIKSEMFDAEELAMTITVKDSKSCNVPLAGVQVELDNTIVQQSGGHVHGGIEDPGTGKYITPVPAADSPTKVTVTTDSNGKATATYKAGIYGVNELITATVTGVDATVLPNRARLPDYVGIIKAEDNYSIKVPGLVPLATDGSQGFTIAGSGGPCDTPHNPETTINRNSIYLTAYARNQATALSASWAIKTGQQGLSYNDASLPNGGFFDKDSFTVQEDQQFGAINKDKRCHEGHRQGTGIDVNRGASGLGQFVYDENDKTKKFVYDMVNIGTLDNPKMIDKKERLTKIAESLNIVIVDEKNSLHYQFD